MSKSKIDRNEILEQLEEARDLMREAHTLLNNAARALNDKHAEAYLVSHLAILIDDEHGYLADDFNVSEWIRQIEDDADGSWEEEENSAQ
jgi:hypothetical protein